MDLSTQKEKVLRYLMLGAISALSIIIITAFIGLCLVEI